MVHSGFQESCYTVTFVNWYVNPGTGTTPEAPLRLGFLRMRAHFWWKAQNYKMLASMRSSSQSATMIHSALSTSNKFLFSSVLGAFQGKLVAKGARHFKQVRTPSVLFPVQLAPTRPFFTTYS